MAKEPYKALSTGGLAPLAAESAGAAAGAAVGLVVAGPAGTLIGAAAGPLLVELVGLAGRRAAQFWSAFRRELSLQNVTEEEWTGRVSSTPAVEQAVLEIFAAAARTMDATRLQVLGEMAAKVPNADDDSAAAAAYFAGVLSSLSEFHFRTLDLVDQLWPARANELGVQPDEIMAAMGPERPLARSLLRTLELNGLIADNARLSRDIIGVFWEVTDLGRSFLALGKSAAASRDRPAHAAS